MNVPDAKRPVAAADNVRRPFDLALRSTRLLGILSTGFGLVILIVFGYHNRLTQFRFHFKLMASIVWVLPGVAFLLAAILMKDRRRWAIILAMVTGGVQLVMAVGLFVANFVFSPISPVPVVMSALWAASLIQLIIYLRRTLDVLHLLEGEEHRGFEAIPKAPVRVLNVEEER